MTIGEKIKMAREAKGLTQEQLGALCGTTKQTIFKYENGIITNIPLDRLEKMAEVLSITPMSLMGWEDTLPSNILPLPNMVKKPRLGTIACGKPILAVEDAISIRAPRAGGDSYFFGCIILVTYFNPRPPCGGRLQKCTKTFLQICHTSQIIY